MTDELHAVAGEGAGDELATDPTIVRMRGALDEAARVEPGTAKPAPASDRRRWFAVAAAAVLVAGGIAALAINMSRDHSTVVSPVPAPGTLLTGSAIIIDMGEGEGPKLAVTLLTSLPPQGGDIPLTGFDWSMVDDEQTVNGTTWSDTLQKVTGTWDGTTFTLVEPTVPAGPTPAPSAPVLDADCAQSTASAAAAAMGDLNSKALHLVEWSGQTRKDLCGVGVRAWFDTQELRDALDGVRAAGHEVQVDYVFAPVPSDVTEPTTTTGLPSGGADAWYEIAAPGLTARPPEFTVCCPAMPAPGPDVVMAWTDNAGGLFMLQAIGHVDGSPAELQFAHYGMSIERADQLAAKVVPGSGLPYVLDDPSMELLAQGFDGIGTSVSQRYIPAVGDGDVVLTVGDYTGQLAALGGPFPAEETTIVGQPGVRYATNSFVVFVWQTPDKTWAELSIAAALASRADEIVASLVPAPRPTDSSTSTSSTVPETTTPTTANGTVDTIPMPADWMFQLIAPDNGFAVPVTFGSALSAGWIISDLEWNPLTADESHPALVEADANANAAVGVPTWGLGTRLDWHDRVNGNASFVVTGVMTSNGSKLIGTNEGHVLVIDVKGPGDEQWTAFATRLPQVIGRFAMTKAIRTPNEDVWRIPTPDAPMYLAAGTIDGPLSPTENIAIVSERTDVGEALTFAQIGSTASWQTLHDGTQNLIAVGKVITGELKPLPIGTVLIVQGRLADGGYVQVYFALAT